MAFVCKWGIMDGRSFSGWGITDRVYFFSDWARLRGRVNKITFAQKNFNMIDVTVPSSGEVFWIEEKTARYWGRVEVYIQAFSSFSLLNLCCSQIIKNIIVIIITLNIVCCWMNTLNLFPCCFLIYNLLFMVLSGDIIFLGDVLVYTHITCRGVRLSHRLFFFIRFSSPQTFQSVSHLNFFDFQFIPHLHQFGPSNITLIAKIYFYHSFVSPARKLPFVCFTWIVLGFQILHLVMYAIALSHLSLVSLHTLLLASSPNCNFWRYFKYHTW